MFKNAIIYRLPTPWTINAEELCRYLAPLIFASPIGLVVALGGENQEAA